MNSKYLHLRHTDFGRLQLAYIRFVEMLFRPYIKLAEKLIKRFS